MFSQIRCILTKSIRFIWQNLRHEFSSTHCLLSCFRVYPVNSILLSGCLNGSGLESELQILIASRLDISVPYHYFNFGLNCRSPLVLLSVASLILLRLENATNHTYAICT